MRKKCLGRRSTQMDADEKDSPPEDAIAQEDAETHARAYLRLSAFICGHWSHLRGLGVLCGELTGFVDRSRGG
jgi:hypothetical protein